MRIKHSNSASAKNTHNALIALFFCTLFFFSVNGQTTGNNGSHDPSRMVECEGRFYVYSTTGDCKSSADGLSWKTEPNMFPRGFPSWVFPANRGVWAPDIIYHNNQYYLYYSVAAAAPASACATGLMTSPTLNPASPDYKWTDRGQVVYNPDNTPDIQFAAIDPAPILDTSGNLWVVWGSGYGKDQSKDQIWITRMDNNTGLPLLSDPSYRPPLHPGYPLATGRKEGAYMHYRNGYYYLFWNTGSCCSGTSSTYAISVSRSRNITGPFTGDRLFYQSTGNIHGPGHMGIYSACGVELFTYHYYPTSVSILGINTLSWNNDGWPVLGSQINKPLVPCGITSTKKHPGPEKGNASINRMQYGMITDVSGICNFPAEFDNVQKEVSIFTYSGKLITKAIIQSNSIDLKRNVGINNGLYLVRIDKL
ncbi:MAG: arabinan endo-1,5-alpha-L-arabinosidase [Fibrobacter sp.]|nr:arabinan endo-1,5-alpha-L-arabinosidase [Fibrobacter sp.]